MTDEHISNDRRFAFERWAADRQGWDTETGAPGIALFNNAVQVWAISQMRPVSVADAARAFNIAPERVVEAVEEHYWMFLEGSPGDYENLMIEHEGE